MDAKVKTFKRKDDLYDWKLVGGNGEEMCGSLQGYTSEHDALEGFLTVQEAVRGGVEVVRIGEVESSDEDTGPEPEDSEA